MKLTEITINTDSLVNILTRAITKSLTIDQLFCEIYTTKVITNDNINIYNIQFRLYTLDPEPGTSRQYISAQKALDDKVINVKKMRRMLDKLFRNNKEESLGTFKLGVNDFSTFYLTLRMIKQ